MQLCVSWLHVDSEIFPYYQFHYKFYSCFHQGIVNVFQTEAALMLADDRRMTSTSGCGCKWSKHLM